MQFATDTDKKELIPAQLSDLFIGEGLNMRLRIGKDYFLQTGEDTFQKRCTTDTTSQDGLMMLLNAGKKVFIKKSHRQVHEY